MFLKTGTDLNLAKGHYYVVNAPIQFLAATDFTHLNGDVWRHTLGSSE